MLNDWVDLAMFHFSVPVEALQPFVPLPLDLWRGQAMVSLVPFRFVNMAWPVLSGVSRLLLRPVSDHRLVNLRTYVRRGHDRAVYFIREFTDHRLNCFIAPRLFGTPYEHADVRPGKVVTAAGALSYTLGAPTDPPTDAKAGSFDRFLLERYVAYACARDTLTRFEVDHSRWRFQRVGVTCDDLSLLESFPWFRHARPVPAGCAHLCQPLRKVRIGMPQRIATIAQVAPPDEAAPGVAPEPQTVGLLGGYTTQ